MPTVRHLTADIYYEVHGVVGPTLVFAYGRGGNAASWWQQVPHFADRYRIIVFDHRAFGRSVCPLDDFHVKHFAGDLAAVLDESGANRISLVCQSMGGQTGLSFALAFPERVRCLVLACTSGGLVTDAIRERRKTRAANLEEKGFDNLALAPDYFGKAPEMAYLYNQIRGFNTGGGPMALTRNRSPDSELDPARLDGYATPTMLITGENDQLYPPPLLHEVAAMIPGSRVQDLPTVGHSAYFEDAPAFNRVVDDFLTQHADG